MNIKNINACIGIMNGEISVIVMHEEGKEITDSNQQLVHLKTIIDKTLFEFEKKYQRKFIPNMDTVYNLPSDMKGE